LLASSKRGVVPAVVAHREVEQIVVGVADVLDVEERPCDDRRVEGVVDIADLDLVALVDEEVLVTLPSDRLQPKHPIDLGLSAAVRWVVVDVGNVFETALGSRIGCWHEAGHECCGGDQR
jgi:hypothetical protein